MVNKITKFLIPIIIILLGFFINKLNALAVSSEINGRCEWSIYQTYYNFNSGSSINIEEAKVFDDISLKNTTNGYKLWFVSNNGKYELHLKSIDNKEKFEFDDMSVSTFKDILTQYYDSQNRKINCPEYISFSSSYSELTHNNFAKIQISTEDEYIKYISNQYNGIIIDDKNNSNKYAHIIKSSDTKPVIFTSRKSNIEITKFDIMKDLFEGANNLKKVYGLYEDEEIGNKNDFYLKTKEMWNSKINEIKSDPNYKYCSQEEFLSTNSQNLSGTAAVLSNIAVQTSDKMSKCSSIYVAKKSFSKWFSIVENLVLEREGYSTFANYFEFSSLLDASENERLNKKLEMLSLTEKYELYAKNKEKVINNKCLTICSSNSLSIDMHGCTNYSQEYNKCYDSLTYCNKISSSSSQEECLKMQMGSNLYSEVNNSYANYISTINSEMEKIRTTIHAFLHPTNTTASFDGIIFDSEGYKVQCEDVEFLHYIYVAMRIIAPILVILFGILDYTKSVLGADEQKVLEARKKFPKRLVVLLLFILIPIIIDTILAIFGVETSLMSCIIKGE